MICSSNLMGNIGGLGSKIHSGWNLTLDQIRSSSLNKKRCTEVPTLLFLEGLANHVGHLIAQTVANIQCLIFCSFRPPVVLMG